MGTLPDTTLKMGVVNVCECNDKYTIIWNMRIDEHENNGWEVVNNDTDICYMGKRD